MRFLLKELYAERQHIKLNVKDKKLLQLLLQNSRTPISQLAKKIGISKSAVVQKIQSLNKKNVLLNPVLYTQARITKNFYVYHIQTKLGMNKKAINDQLLGVEDVVAVLWYHGTYDIILVSIGKDPQTILEQIEKIIPIKKLRTQRVIDNWYHPPHVFNEIPDKKTSFSRKKPILTELDEKILFHLTKDPKDSLLSLSKTTKSSPITVKKRIKELTNNGAIISFSNYINFWLIGRDLVSVSFIVKGRKNTDSVIKQLLGFSQTGNIWEFEHEWNINVVFWVKNQIEVNTILQSLNKSCEGILDTEIMILAGMVGK